MAAGDNPAHVEPWSFQLGFEVTALDKSVNGALVRVTSLWCHVLQLTADAARGRPHSFSGSLLL
jgi:hypothetical protein